MKKAVALFSAVCVAFIASAANTWFVDDDNYNASGDGMSAATAFGTIQEAVEAASSGDTVKVLPGTYDKGVTDDGTMNSRVVVIGKTLTIESTGGKEVTHIVGAHTTDPSGYGDDAIRCIYARPPNAPNGGKIKFVGFTIRDGQAKANTSANHSGMGGGLNAVNQTYTVYLIDCTVKNCRASRGAGMLGGCAVRTLFVGNKNLYAHGGIATGAALYNCIGTGCTLKGQPALQGCFAVNCTFFGNYRGSMASENSLLRNCLLTLNENTALGGGPFRDLRHSVLAGAYSGEVSTDYGIDGFEGFVADVPSRQMLAPALGDLRPMAGTAAATNGLADIMYDTAAMGSTAMPDNEDRYLDFYKNPIPTTGAICAGAVQEVAPTAGGALTFAAGTISVFGCPTLVNDIWACTETYPAQILLTADMFNGGTDIYSYWISSDIPANWRPAMMDDSFYAMPPPDKSASLAVGVKWATAAYHVNPSGGSDTLNDGLSTNAPFKTLQKAADVICGSTNLYGVVYAAAGLYDEASQGTTSVGDSFGTHPSILAVTNTTTFIRFKGAGKGLSTIEGKADTVTAYYGGCGPNAIRCVYFGNVGVIQGFTFKNGFSGWINNTAGMSLSTGGSIYGSTYTIGADCVFSNSAAARGAVYGGGYSRCEFYDCTGWNTGTRNCHYFSSCQFVNCAGTGAGSFLYGDPTVQAIVHCSSYYGGQDQNVYGGPRPVWNSVFSGGKSVSEASSIAGCVFANYASIDATNGYTIADPTFGSTRDLRPVVGSPLFTAGEKPTPENYGANYYLYATVDLNGKPWKVGSDGVPMVGCHSRAVTKVDISTPSLGTVSPSGAMLLEDGQSVTVTYTPDAAHAATRPPFQGIMVNGENVTSGSSYVLTAPGADADPMYYSVIALVATNWYVNAARPDDSGDGFTPETAKRTLAAIMSCDLLSGDVVHAAAGEYAEGGMTNVPTGSATGITTNRVALVAGVTLVGDEGAEKTIIRGKRGDPANGYGRGPGAMRCVYMPANSTLRGFTLVDGNTAYIGTTTTADQDNTDSSGGGIWAEDFVTAKVYDCIITNCAANRGGGAYRGYFVNCRFSENASIGAGQGDAAVSSRLYGCYVGHQRSSNGTKGVWVMDNCTVENVTVGQIPNSTSISFKNTLFLEGTVISAITANGTGFENCIFADIASVTSSVGSVATYTNCKFYPSSELQLAADLTPLYGSCKAIDAGDNALVSAELATDAAGIQRVYNAKVDVGAFEYDWRPRYVADLGVAVPIVSPGVVETVEGESVTIIEGALDLNFTGGTPNRINVYTVPVTVLGAGTLSGTLNGEAYTNLTAAAGATAVVFRNKEPTNRLVLSYDGGDSGVLVSRVIREPIGTCFRLR